VRIGVVFPQTEIGADPGAVRAYAERVSELGFAHILAYDHVVGADPAVHQGWRGPYDVTSTFYEPLVLFAYLSAICDLELVSGIVILPQRQAVLVAKQAATLDVLCGGRLRLGVGIGWNAVEYEALGANFHDRGRRMEEQIEFMRRLWTEPAVSFEGRHHRVHGAGLAPLPVQRPIPLWLGAFGDKRALARIGRIADGWIPLLPPGPELEAAKAVITAAAQDAGRDPATIGMEGRLDAGQADQDKIAADAGAWREAGATHLSVNTMRAGLATVDAHLDTLRRAAATLFS